MATTEIRHTDIKKRIQWARKHTFVPPKKSDNKRASPEERFAMLFNIMLHNLEKPKKGDVSSGNIWMYNHGKLAEESLKYCAKRMSVATMFNYFRSGECLRNCAVAWAMANEKHEDPRTEKLATRILTQYYSVVR